MKFKEKCIGCNLGIWFEKKDIKKVPKWLEEEFASRRQEARKLLNQTTMKGLIFKKKEYTYDYRFQRDLIKINLTIPIGVIKCGACGKRQLILKKANDEEGVK